MAASSSKSEQSYIRSALVATPPLRADGRALLDFRPIALQTRVAPLANGSARVSIGGTGLGGVGGGPVGTEVLAAVKLEVEDIVNGKGVDGGRVECYVSCSPSAYPHLTSLALDDHQHDLTAILSDTITHPSLHPTNLNILRGKKSWLLHVDLLVLSDNGNLHDALFIAAAAALNSTRVPRTREVEYRARTRTATGGSAGALPGSEDAPMGEEGVKQSGLDTREVRKTADFELADYWDEGEPLRCAGPWPICITLNLLPPLYYLDASALEESATSLRLLFLFSFQDYLKPSSVSRLQGTRLLGPGEVDSTTLKPLLRLAEGHARELQTALAIQLLDEQGKRLPKSKLARR